MRHVHIVAALGVMLLMAIPALSAQAPKPAEMGRVQGLAEELTAAAVATSRGADLFAHSNSPYEARTLHTLRNLEMKARHFEDALEEKRDDPQATVETFATLFREYCRSGDQLWAFEAYGVLGPSHPWRGIRDLGPAHADFQRVRLVMNELKEYYGYEDCGVYSRYWSDED